MCLGSRLTLMCCALACAGGSLGAGYNLSWNWQMPDANVPSSLAFFPDGDSYVVGTKGYALRIYQTTTGRLLRTIPVFGDCRKVLVTPDGHWVLAAIGASVQVFDPETCLPIGSMSGPTQFITDMALTPNGQFLAAVSGATNWQLWDVQTGNLIRTITSNQYLSYVAISADGHTVAASSQTYVGRWNLDTGAGLSGSISTLPFITDLAYSPDGQWFAATHSNTDADKAYVVRASDFHNQFTLTSTITSAKKLAFSPDSQRLSLLNLGGQVLRWRTDTWAPLSTLTGWPGSNTDTMSTSYSPDGRYYATSVDVSSSNADQTRVWDANTDAVVSVTSGQASPSQIGLSSDGQFMISSSHDHTVKVWNVVTGALVRSFAVPGNSAYSAAISPDGQWLACGGDDVYIYNYATGALVTTYNSSTCSAVMFAPDSGSVIASESGHRFNRIQCSSGALLGAWNTSGTPNNLVMMPDGLTFAASLNDGTQSKVEIWTLGGTYIRGMLGPAQTIWRIAVSPDGSRIAAAMNDKMVRVWRVSDRQLLWTLNGHTDIAYSVAFSPSGNFILSGSIDRTLRYWDVQTGQQVALVTGRVGRQGNIIWPSDSPNLYFGGTISGSARNPVQFASSTLTLADTSSLLAQPRTLVVTLKQGNSVLATRTITASARVSNIVLDLPSEALGDCTIQFEGAPFLRRIVPVTLSGSEQMLPPVVMVNGDTDHSGEVDAADIDQVIGDFGNTWPGGLGSPFSDVDSTGEVDAADIDVVILNFGAVDN